MVVSIVVVGVMIVDMGVGGTSVADVAAASVVLIGAAKAVVVVVVVDKILKFGNGVPEVFGVYKCVVTLGRNND